MYVYNIDTVDSIYIHVAHIVFYIICPWPEIGVNSSSLAHPHLEAGLCTVLRTQSAVDSRLQPALSRSARDQPAVCESRSQIRDSRDPTAVSPSKQIPPSWDPTLTY